MWLLVDMYSISKLNNCLVSFPAKNCFKFQVLPTILYPANERRKCKSTTMEFKKCLFILCFTFSLTQVSKLTRNSTSGPEVRVSQVLAVSLTKSAQGFRASTTDNVFFYFFETVCKKLALVQKKKKKRSGTVIKMTFRVRDRERTQMKSEEATKMSDMGRAVVSGRSFMFYWKRNDRRYQVNCITNWTNTNRFFFFFNREISSFCPSTE